MAYILKTIPANHANYGDSRKTDTIKYLAIHYTANDGDTAEANGNYFKNNIIKASTHYIVDDNTVIRSVPDDYTAWGVGGSKYSNCDTNGGGKWYGKCTNANSISIEFCDVKKNGKSDFTEATLANGAQLIKELMNKYKIPAANVIRHFDVNGKICPKPFVDSPKEWSSFLTRLSAPAAPAVSVKEYKVKISTGLLNIRSGASMENKVVGTVKREEVYTIIEERNGWGKLK